MRKPLQHALVGALALGAAAVAPAQAHARNCVAYADAAVYQQQLNLSFGCGYVGFRWSRAWRAHRRWCVGAYGGRPLEEFRIRNAVLRSCGVPNGQLPAPWLG